MFNNTAKFFIIYYDIITTNIVRTCTLTLFVHEFKQGELPHYRVNPDGLLQ